MLQYLLYLKKNLLLTKIYIYKKEITLQIQSNYLIQTLKFLKNNEFSRFDILTDICAVDYIASKKRFEIVYHILSLTYNQRLRLKLYTDEIASINSSTEVFSSASWWEREIWDLYGIFFKNHPDLRRILTDYGFVGHPFRKDFPLTGFFEVRYDEYKKLVIQEKIEFAQEFRVYSYISPWN